MAYRHRLPATAGYATTETMLSRYHSRGIVLPVVPNRCMQLHPGMPRNRLIYTSAFNISRIILEVFLVQNSL